MVLRLDPRYPLVWRSPSSLQFGVDPSVVLLDEVSATQERMIAALVSGVSEPGLAMIAGAELAERDALLVTLAPLLAAPNPPPTATIAVTGIGPLVDATATALAGSGHRVLVAARPDDLAAEHPDLAIAVAHFVIPPEFHGTWLRRDVPHLPVVFSDGAVLVGPLVEPGRSACLYCLELHRRDADSAWPAVASQLLGRRGTESAVLVLEAAAAACRMVTALLAGGTVSQSVRIDGASGERVLRHRDPHPECGCRGLPELAGASAGLPGNGWAAEHREPGRR